MAMSIGGAYGTWKGRSSVRGLRRLSTALVHRRSSYVAIEAKYNNRIAIDFVEDVIYQAYSYMLDCRRVPFRFNVPKELGLLRVEIDAMLMGFGVERDERSEEEILKEDAPPRPTESKPKTIVGGVPGVPGVELPRVRTDGSSGAAPGLGACGHSALHVVRGRGVRCAEWRRDSRCSVCVGGGGALEGERRWRALSRARAQAVAGGWTSGSGKCRRLQNGWRAVGGSGKRVDRN